MEKICKSYIDGKWVSPKSSSPIKRFNPADIKEEVSEILFADDRLADYAVEKANGAAAYWRKTSIVKRIELVEKFLELFISNRNKLAGTITKENGKTLSESYSEIDSALRESNYQIEFLRNSTVEQISNSKIIYEPLGVVLLITPWNFPVATILRKLIPALLTGNTIIVKPSELTPLSSVALFKLFEEVDFPNGVINLVLGDGNVGSYLCRHTFVRAISLTGSSITGNVILKQISGRNVRMQAEMGGKNTVVVLKDANIEKAAKDIVYSSYACSGQWCTGTSKVIAEKEVYDLLMQRLIDHTSKIVIGNGFDENVTMSPLISQAQLDKTLNAVTQANNEKAELVIGGEKPRENTLEYGYFFEPTIYSNVKPEMFISQEEIFGPVLSVLKAENFDDALKLTNISKYGLAFSIYTNVSEKAEKFIKDVKAGVCHINLPTSYRDPALPLLGWENSGYGLPESGRFARDFFTRTKVIYKAE